MSESLMQEVRSLLAQMAVLAEAPAGQITASSGHAKPESQAPRGDGDAMFDKWAAMFAKDSGEYRLRRLIAFARAELAMAQKRTFPAAHDRKEEAQTIEDIIVLGRGMTCSEVAALVSQDGKGHCPPSYIAKVRRQNDVSMADGTERPPLEWRIALARRLESEGKPQRRIASEMGVSQSTVSRLLQAAKDEMAA